MEMIWLIMGRFIKYLRVHTPVIHFLRHSPGHCRPGHCVHFSTLQRWETPMGWEISRFPGTLCPPARVPSAFGGAKPPSIEALLRESEPSLSFASGPFSFWCFSGASHRPHLTLPSGACRSGRGGLCSLASSRHYSRLGCTGGVLDTLRTPAPRPQLGVAGEHCLDTQGLAERATGSLHPADPLGTWVTAACSSQAIVDCFGTRLAVAEPVASWVPLEKGAKS